MANLEYIPEGSIWSLAPHSLNYYTHKSLRFLLIKIYATTVNRTDCGSLRAKPSIVRLFSGLTKPKNTILGCEFAGKIEAVGRDVTSFKVGDKVFGYNDKDFGAHAEYLTMPQNGTLANMPTNMTYDETAPSIEGVHYALNYIRAAHIRKQQKALIYGATGAIGSAAVQLAKYYGGRNYICLCY